MVQCLKSMPWIFGPGFTGHPDTVQMKELKRFDVHQRVKAFQARTEAFYLKQVDVFQQSPPWAPFPLAVMTCIGVEMVGSYKYGDAFGDRNDHFKNLVEDMDAGFGQTHSAPDGKDHKLSYFIYKGFRNSLAHGYYGEWVFITHQSDRVKKFRYSPPKKLVVLNVYWFYQRFKKVCLEYFAQLLADRDPGSVALKTFNATFEKKFSLWLK